MEFINNILIIGGLWYSTTDELVNQIKYITITDKIELQKRLECL
jgi:hypothetical protein